MGEKKCQDRLTEWPSVWRQIWLCLWRESHSALGYNWFSDILEDTIRGPGNKVYESLKFERANVVISPAELVPEVECGARPSRNCKMQTCYLIKEGAPQLSDSNKYLVLSPQSVSITNRDNRSNRRWKQIFHFHFCLFIQRLRLQRR